MSESIYHRDTCRLCDGRDLELVLPLEPTPIAGDYVSAEHIAKVQEIYPLDLFLCHNCGHVQLLDVVDPEILFGEYIYLTRSSPSLVEYFRKYASEVLDRYNPPKSALVIDIGSNDGSFLKFFKDAGVRVLGIDPARDIASMATESGIETLPTYFTFKLAHMIKKEYGPAAIITANNVFAHVGNLADMLDGVHDLLNPDGIFVFEVSYLVDIVEKMLFDTIYHEHLCYHSVKPLEAFFRQHDMELIDVKRISSKGGSLHGTVQLAGGPKKASPSVAKLIALEEELCIDRSETFKAFSDKIDGLKLQLLSLLYDLRVQDKTIAGYGASTTVTTLIYQFRLGDLLSYLVDDNPQKHNTFSPGLHIPVLSSEVLYEWKTDYVVILAWNYSEPIIKKHHAFLNQGGHFIVPLPKVEVI